MAKKKKSQSQVGDLTKPEFVAYLLSFYSKQSGSLDYFTQWGYKPMTKTEATLAYEHVFKLPSWGGGDSVDRERARDFVLRMRGIEPPID